MSALALGGCVEVLDLDRFSIGDDAERDGSVVGGDACLPGAFYRDADGDGYGTPDDTVSACAAPAGYVSADGDCDDSASAIAPGAEELCDGIDQDCDATLDEGLTPRVTFYRDEDGDGTGDDAATIEACEAPTGHVAAGGDCAPSDGAVFPGAAESCDGLDQDCDTGIDEGALELRGSARVIESGVRSSVLTFGGGAFWLAWANGPDIHIMQLDRDGLATGLRTSWTTGSSSPRPSLAIAETPVGARGVVAWREGSEILARVFDPADASLSSSIMLGGSGGDQRFVTLEPLGPRVVAAWFSSTQLRARTIDPVGVATQGALLDEEVSSMSGEYFRFPSLAADSTRDRLWVVMPVRRGTDLGSALYLGWIEVGASPVWSGPGSLARATPYPDVFIAYTATPADARLPVLAATTTGSCLTVASLSDPLTFSECAPTVGRPASPPVRRGGVISALFIHGTDQLSLVDLADAEGTAGGGFLDIVSSPVSVTHLATSDDPRRALVTYEAGDAAPYTLTVQAVGCGP